MLEKLQESLDYSQSEEFSEQDARSVDRTPRSVRSVSGDVSRPDRKTMEDNWQLYKEFGLVRASIRGFASEVISPGYYVQTENEELREELEEWLSSCAIISGEHDKDFFVLAKKSTIQREVRGTALIEKVPTTDGNLYGFKMINPEKVKAYTKPGQAILYEPDEDLEALAEKYENFDPDEVKFTEDGEVAAYVQWDRSMRRFNESNIPEIPFTKDQIIKLTRDEDVGEIWGNSRLNSVRDRVESLLEKLENNDDAIRATAHPFWLFKMGEEDDPWTEDEIKEFMSNHEGDEFASGMKQAVQGNVSIDTISGDVAEIESFLDFDVDMIMAEMPIPKYALGAFEENVNQFVSRSQETELRKQVKEARKELESEFTPVVKEKASELGYSEEDVISLRIGTPPEERVPEDEEDGQEDAVSDDGFGGDLSGEDGPRDTNGDDDGDGEPETDFSRPPASSEMARVLWNSEPYVDEFAETGGPRDTLEFSELSELTEDFFLNVRDKALDELSGHDELLQKNSLGFRSADARDIDRVVEKMTDRAERSFGFEEQALGIFRSALREELDILAGEEQGVNIRTSFADKEIVRNHVGNYRNSVEDFVNEFGKEVRTEFRRSYNRGDDIEEAIDRVRDRFNDDMISQRAGIIAHMEIHNARQTTRLEKFEESDDIIGVKVENECRPGMTPLSARLAGCMGPDQAVALFDEGSLSEQWMDQVPEAYLHNGFDPLPRAPPFFFGDNSRLEPVYEDDLGEME